MDLKNSVDIDIIQIESLISTLLESEKLINNLQNDIDKKHTLLSDYESIQMIIEIEVGFSFFPKDGIFNQMISTGAFELISRNDLKFSSEKRAAIRSVTASTSAIRVGSSENMLSPTNSPVLRRASW